MENLSFKELPLFQRRNIYSKARKFRQEGLSYNQISKQLGVPFSTVAWWFWKPAMPISYSEAARRPRVHPNLFSSPELSYLVGVICGDGYLTTRNTIGLRVKSKAFAEKFSRVLTKVMGRKKLCPIYIERKRGFFRVIAKSMILHNFLSQNFDDIKPRIEPYVREFIQGMFDSEGNVCKGKGATHITICNTNRGLLDYISNKLAQLHFHAPIYHSRPKSGYTGKPVDLYHIDIYRKKDVAAFKELFASSPKIAEFTVNSERTKLEWM